MREAWYTAPYVKHGAEYLPRLFEAVGAAGSGWAAVGLAGSGEAAVGERALVKVRALDAEHAAILEVPEVLAVPAENVVAEGAARLGALFRPERVTFASGKAPTASGTWADDFSREADEDLEDSADWTLLDAGYAGRMTIDAAEDWVYCAHWDVAGCYANASTARESGYAQVTILELDLTSIFGPAIRANGASDMYGGAQVQKSGTDDYRIYKNMSTILASYAEELPSPPFVLRIEKDGANLELFAGGASKVSTTDSSLTGTGYGGVFHGSAGSGGDFDDFETGALSSPPPAAGGARRFKMARRLATHGCISHGCLLAGALGGGGLIA